MASDVDQADSLLAGLYPPVDPRLGTCHWKRVLHRGGYHAFGCMAEMLCLHTTATDLTHNSEAIRRSYTIQGLPECAVQCMSSATRVHSWTGRRLSVAPLCKLCKGLPIYEFMQSGHVHVHHTGIAELCIQHKLLLQLLTSDAADSAVTSEPYRNSCCCFCN